MVNHLTLFINTSPRTYLIRGVKADNVSIPASTGEVTYSGIFNANASPQDARAGWWNPAYSITPVATNSSLNIRAGSPRTGSSPPPFNCPIPPPPIPEYPLGINLPAPRIVNPEDFECIDRSVSSRPGCAVQAYIGITEYVYETQGVLLTWEKFIAFTIMGEASILYINPDDPSYDLNCFFGNNGASTPIPNNDCGNLRLLFEQSIVRQLYQTCGLTCTQEEFIQFLAGPPFDQNGIQAWYQAGSPTGTPDLTDLISGVFVGSNTNYVIFEDNAANSLANPNLQGGCGGYACSWGNPTLQPPPPYYYFSHIDTDPNDNYGQFGNRIYFIVGR